MDPGTVVVNTPKSDLHTTQSYLTSQMAHLAKAYLSLCRVKRLGALLLSLPKGYFSIADYPTPMILPVNWNTFKLPLREGL